MCFFFCAWVRSRVVLMDPLSDSQLRVREDVFVNAMPRRMIREKALAFIRHVFVLKVFSRRSIFTPLLWFSIQLGVGRLLLPGI